jgi:hypothetical protein
MNKIAIKCHLTHLVDEIRSYIGGDGYENRDDYAAIVNVVWLSDSKVMLRGANGKVSRNTLLSCFDTLKAAGAKTAILTRKTGKRMPFAKLIVEGEHENTWEIDLYEQNCD